MALGITPRFHPQLGHYTPHRRPGLFYPVAALRFFADAGHRHAKRA